MRRLRFWAAVGLLLLGWGTAQAAPGTKWTLVLPDAGTYSYWVQAKSGTVAALPTTVAHKAAVPLPGSPATGDTLCVLDAHTGQIAAKPLGAPGPVAFALPDFKPLPAQAPPAPAASPPPAAPPKEHPDAPNGFAILFSWLLGLAVAGAVVWFVLRLVRTRGEPLLALARRAGVDVPDPKPLDPNADAPLPLYEAPNPRAVEKIPEDAGALPAPRRPENLPRKLSPPTGEPQLIGTQGLAAGSTFALTDGSVTVGRDGDNGIVLAEHTVSRRHARLTRDGQGQITLTDEGSANGLFVNGERVTETTLAHGDEIKIGDNYFLFEA